VGRARNRREGNARRDEELPRMTSIEFVGRLCQMPTSSLSHKRPTILQ